LLHTVARLHYQVNLPQVQIARQLALSTATISRLLQRARAEGIVQIEVRDLLAPAELEARLAARLKLKRVAVVEAAPGRREAGLGAPLGAIMREAGLGPGAVLAIGWGRTVRAVIASGLPALPGIDVVAATGGLQQHEPHFQINEFVRLAAEQTGGTPHFLHAPYLPAAEARAAFLADPAILGSVALWRRLDAAIVGIGLPVTSTPPEASVATPGEKLLAHAAGDVIRHYFDEAGTLIHWEGEERMIAVPPEALRAAKLVIGIAADEAKAPSIIGAARSGLISALVTDAKTAEAILDRLGG
jgi:DNA-binding transcriptional regulator LsrR (DeoR family)